MLSYKDQLISPKFQKLKSTGRNLQILVKLENNISIKVNKTDKIIDVKSKCYEIFHIDQTEIEFVFQGQILDDERTVEECEMCEASVIDMLAKLSGGMQIFAKTTDGRRIAIEVSKIETISDIKKKIQEKIGLNPVDQKLVFKGKLLKDDKTIDEYRIAEKSVINVLIRLRSGMQIFSKTMDGKTVTFEVSKNETIIDIKKKIQEKIGLDPDEQKLVFQGELLKDDKTVDEYGIVERSVINVVERLRGTIQIYARTMEGKTATFSVSKTEKIRDIKKKIQEIIELSLDEQNLVFQYGILDEHQTVDEYQICEKSVINVVERLRNGIQIFAKTIDGKTVVIEVLKSCKISDLKIKIQEKIGMHPDYQRLVFQDSFLEDDKTVDEYQIDEKSVINVVARLRDGMQIFAKTLDGKTVRFKVSKTEKISDIKKKIEEKIGLNPDDQKLVFRGELLEDDKTVDESQIDENSVINVLIRLRFNWIQIFAQPENGKTVLLEVRENEKVIYIKQKLQLKVGLDPDKQKLLFQNQILQDDKTVEECGICDQSVINVVARLGSNWMQIFAKTTAGRTAGFDVNVLDKVGDVEIKFQTKLGLPPNQHKLIFRDAILQNDKTMEYYGIDNKSVIDIVAR